MSYARRGMNRESLRRRALAGLLATALLPAPTIRAGADEPPASQTQDQSPATPAPETGPPIDVWLVEDGARQKLSMLRARVAKAESSDDPGANMAVDIAKSILSQVPVLGTLFGFMQMVQPPPAPQVRFIFAVPGLQSAIATRSANPTFEISYAALSGTALEGMQPVFVRLTPYKQYYRITGITSARALDAAERAMHGKPMDLDLPNHELRINARTETLAVGQLRITPEKTLDPGEYAVAFRATHGSLDPTIAFAIWDFRLAAPDSANPAPPASSPLPAASPAEPKPSV